MKTIAVFFGGRSNEHEISVITGVYAVNLLRNDFEVLPVYLPKTGGMKLFEKMRRVEDFRDLDEGKLRSVTLRPGGLADERHKRRFVRIDCALNCCHGGFGEGGGLAALLDWNDIPSASPDMTSSAIFLDKVASKLCLKGLVPVVDWEVIREGEGRESVEEKIGRLKFPVIVKPPHLGSSIGVSVARSEEALEKSLALAFRLDGAALVEKYLAGKRDLNCAAYRDGGKIVLSPVEEVFSDSSILTFGEKYEGAGSRTSRLPADIPPATEEQIKEMLARVYETFHICGVVRGDFLLSGEEVYFNELNTVPGTLATYLFGGSLSEARALLVTLVEEGMRRGLERRETVSSGILGSPVFGGKSAKRR